MRHVIAFVAFTLVSATAVRAQEITIPRNIESLADRAVETVNVTVDRALLQLAGKFLMDSDPEQRLARNIISNLKRIHVRSFEFARPGEYSENDLESLRSQVKAPVWTRMAAVRSKRAGEDVDVFLRTNQDRIDGVVVLAAQPTRLTFVNIDGPIDLDSLARLGGQFGIPKLDLERARE